MGDHIATFADIVRDERHKLGLTQQQAADRSGGLISLSQWRVVETAPLDRYAPRTYRGLEIALGWQTGCAAALHADPTIAIRYDPARARPLTLEELEERVRRLEEAARRQETHQGQ